MRGRNGRGFLYRADRKTVRERNQSLAIWRKQPDGPWKCSYEVMSPVPTAARNAK